MKKVATVIERAGDGKYSVYSNDDTLEYLITGTGDTAEEAVECFKAGYADTRNYFAKHGREFEEVEFVYEYDMTSFLDYFSKAMTLAGLSRITGINQGQLSHYATGRRSPSLRTKEKMQRAIHAFGQELSAVKFA